MQAVSRRTLLKAGSSLLGAGALTAALTSLSACGSNNSSTSRSGDEALSSSDTSLANDRQGGSSAASAPASATNTAAQQLAIGSLSTEDILPLWVAEDAGLYDSVATSPSIVGTVAPFQSAAELIAGISAGSAELAMTDIMVTASLFAAGIDVKMEWVTLGADASQGRFGILVGPQSSVETLEDLAGVPIGVGTNTILEYVMDTLMQQAGVPEDQVIVEEIQKLPMRYQAVVSGQVAAAALPGSLLALGEAQGCRVIADDTQSQNISQSVMISRADKVSQDGKEAAVAALASVWDAAVDLINANPEAYRRVLVEGASLPDAVADTYPISEYPKAALPTSAMVVPVLDWMLQKGYLSQPLSYDETTGTFT